MLGDLANTTKIVRDNAPGRGKLLYRVEGAIPPSASWKTHADDKHPAAEFLSTGRHALVPPSEYGDGCYRLVDGEHGIMTVSTATIERIWWLITGEHLDKNSRPARTSENANQGEYKRLIRDAWPTRKVFEHFDRHTNGAVEGRTETRLLGNGGLLINDWRWYNHAAGVGGDQFDAWAWCKDGHIVDRSDGKGFWVLLTEMGDAAGIPRLQSSTAAKPKRTPAPDRDDSDDSDEPEQSYSGRTEKPKQADELYKLALKLGHFFTGRGDSQPYASVAVDGHREVYRLKSERFNDWLSFAYYQQNGTIVSAQARADAKSLLAFEARKSIEDVFVRVGQHLGKVYLDLGSPEGDAIEVDAAGWRVVAVPPVHFYRAEHIQPLPLPVPHRDPILLGKYLNIEEADWPLVAAWVVSALHPRGPYPVLAFLSRAGSGKSTALRVLKRILDPSSAELRSQPGDVRDLFIAASNSWVVGFENVSTLSPEASDALCIISTGGGYTKRANYSDDTEHVISVQRPVMINGIGDVITRQDLMDRTIVIGTPYMAEEHRREEGEFWQEFEEDKAKILGAFLYALSVGLRNINTVQLPKKPRMADFARLAGAAESAYTDGRYSFQAEYTSNRERAADTIVENSPVGEVLLRVLGSMTEMSETPQDLFLKLTAMASEHDKKITAWPKHHNQLKEILERIAPALDRLGVRVEFRKTNGKRVVKLWRTV
jgi:energy-coupling factor transporter ATP-binding protein EcfA2